VNFDCGLLMCFGFGRAIYLGETFCSYISINNSSAFEVRDVVIKVSFFLLLFLSNFSFEVFSCGNFLVHNGSCFAVDYLIEFGALLLFFFSFSIKFCSYISIDNILISAFENRNVVI
jgi:uncharacterized protein DUF974